MSSLSSNEAIGTTARLNAMRLGASRLGAKVTVDNLSSANDGTYAWKRSDSGVKHGDPPTSVENSWTISRGDD